MPCFLVEFKDPNTSNITAYINQKIIVNLVGTTKPTKKQTHCTLKLKKTNHVHTHSSVPIVKAITRQTPIYVCFGNTGSIMNSTTKSILRSMKIGQNQFVLSWMRSHNDLWHFKDFFSKCLKKFSNCQYYSRESIVFQHCFHSRTSVVDHLYNSELH